MKCWISESMGSWFWLPLPWKVYMYLLCVGSGLFSKLGAYRNAVGVARKHFVNWPELVVSAFLGRGGVFRSRGGGVSFLRRENPLKKVCEDGVCLEASRRHTPNRQIRR
jgi:hypothetical protein